jgi:predicted RNA-binding protein with TRAM domain
VARGLSTWHGLNEGQEVEVKITDVSRSGYGVGRVEGCIIFVKNAKVGEKVRVRITKFSVRSAHAEIVQRL